VENAKNRARVYVGCLGIVLVRYSSLYEPLWLREKMEKKCMADRQAPAWAYVNGKKTRRGRRSWLIGRRERDELGN